MSASLTLRQAADTAGMSPVTIRRHLRDGDLPATRDRRGHYRVDSDDLALWLAGRSIDEAIAQVVAAAPALSDVQRSRLTGILQGGAA